MDGAQGFNYSFNTISASILLEYYCAVIFFPVFCGVKLENKCSGMCGNILFF